MDFGGIPGPQNRAPGAPRLLHERNKFGDYFFPLFIRETAFLPVRKSLNAAIDTLNTADSIGERLMLVSAEE